MNLSASFSIALPFKLAVTEGDKQKSNKLFVALSLYNLTAALINLGKYDDALPYTVRRVEYYRENMTGYTPGRIGSSKLLADCYVNTNKPVNATLFYE